ncbi:MAG: Tat pathway signal protein [Campylobacteraceae bacterium]
MIQNSRRVFIKKALVASSVVGIAGVTLASTKGKNVDNGVVSGKSNKKEILYKKTPTWEEYYKAAH